MSDKPLSEIGHTFIAEGGTNSGWEKFWDEVATSNDGDVIAMSVEERRELVRRVWEEAQDSSYDMEYGRGDGEGIEDFIKREQL